MSAHGHAGTAPRDAQLRAELGRLARFCAVGAANTVITLVVYGALVAFGWPVALASAAGFGLGAANGYRWNARWTFRASGRRPGALLRYVVVQALGAGLSALGTAGARAEGLTRLSAEVVTVPCVTVIAYCLSRLLVFRAPAA